MKKYILAIGLVLLAFNTIIGLLVSSYPAFNIILADINIIISIIISLVLALSKIDSKYKITLAIAFIFTGLARLFASISSDNTIRDNNTIIGILIILAIEIIVILIAHSLKKEE